MLGEEEKVSLSSIEIKGYSMFSNIFETVFLKTHDESTRRWIVGN